MAEMPRTPSARLAGRGLRQWTRMRLELTLFLSERRQARHYRVRPRVVLRRATRPRAIPRIGGQGMNQPASADAINLGLEMGLETGRQRCAGRLGLAAGQLRSRGCHPVARRCAGMTDAPQSSSCWSARRSGEWLQGFFAIPRKSCAPPQPEAAG